VLRDGGLADPELLLDRCAHGACAGLAVREQLENATADRVPEDVECVHATIVASCLI
jgi:hypothetical protein